MIHPLVLHCRLNAVVEGDALVSHSEQDAFFRKPPKQRLTLRRKQQPRDAFFRLLLVFVGDLEDYCTVLTKLKINFDATSLDGFECHVFEL